MKFFLSKSLRASESFKNSYQSSEDANDWCFTQIHGFSNKLDKSAILKKWKMFFSWIAAYIRHFLSIKITSQKYACNLFKLTWFYFPHFSEKIPLYHSLRKLSKWHIFPNNTYVTLILAWATKKVFRVFFCSFILKTFFFNERRKIKPCWLREVVRKFWLEILIESRY